MKFKILILFLIFFSCSFTKADWTQTNGIYGGPVNKMYSYENKIFVGTPNSGVYVSDDGGISYTQRNNGLTDLDVNDFTSAGKTIYAATGNSGVFKSTDEGLIWAAVNTGLTNMRISSLAVNGSKIFASNDSGVFRSTNSGASWIRIFSDVNIDVSVSSIATTLNNIFITGIYLGIYRSTNDGDNWEHVLESSTGLFTTMVSSDSNIFACGLLTGIRRSTNLGLTWTTLNFITSIVYSLGVNGSTVFAGIGGSSANLYISSNNGNNWDSSSIGLPRIGYSSVLSILFNSSNLFVIVPQGVYKSTNSGQNWFNSSANIIASSISTLYNFNNRIYTASYENGISYTTNNGKNWIGVNQNLSSGTVISIGSCDSVLFIGTYGGNYKSTNYGTNWIPSNLGFTDASRAFISNNGAIMGLAYAPYKSTDYGMFWFLASSGFNSGGIGNAFLQIENKTYAAARYKIFLSSNFGVIWTELPRAWIASTVTTMTSIGNYLVAGVLDSGIYLTNNDGNSWQRINNGLTNKKIQALHTNSNKVFAGTQGGVFATTNNGTNWLPINNGLTNFNITSLVSSSTYLFAGTGGSGVWKIPLSEILTAVNSYSNTHATFYLYQNYPNPFNPKTIISYQLKMFSYVKIKVYDVLGNEVKSLLDKNQNEGTYEVEFDGSNLSSGIYFYTLRSESYKETKTMILIK